MKMSGNLILKFDWNTQTYTLEKKSKQCFMTLSLTIKSIKENNNNNIKGKKQQQQQQK